MALGGRRIGAGRPKGAKNKKKKDIDEVMNKKKALEYLNKIKRFISDWDDKKNS